MKVLFIAAECAPVVKVGGLADVVGSLPKALQKLGVEVSIIIPMYGVLDAVDRLQSTVVSNLQVHFGNRDEVVKVWQSVVPKTTIPLYLVDHPWFSAKKTVYLSPAATVESDTEVERFGLFDLAVCEFLSVLYKPDILHLHDWHTAMIPDLLRLKYHQLRQKIKTVLTMHNIGASYQGRAGSQLFDELGIAKNDLPQLPWPKFDGINFLQSGILAADAVTTVSPSYAKEILTQQYCAELCPALEKRKDVLSGILNGIDYEDFDPEKDPALPMRYSAANWSAGKVANKQALQQQLGLALDPAAPLFGMVTRLDEQKGIALLLKAAADGKLPLSNEQLVILGTGRPDYEERLHQWAAKHPRQVAVVSKFDAKLASQIYAGSDFLLIPSQWEPSGLTQMIAMRYGTVPVVRKTGGLADTVKDGKTGIVFDQYSVEALVAALERAMTMYLVEKKEGTSLSRVILSATKDLLRMQDPNKLIDASPAVQHDNVTSPSLFINLVQNCLHQDFSWAKSAKEYTALYERMYNK